ncbi:MAG: alcohol dehydrogenase catalytic domain-containing protein [Candidatus Bathyarchaeota archaeon]|nr:alcohol dehydrogenase catalytic domain-containing protein [Candidatus Bathyarchaeota archaeon]
MKTKRGPGNVELRDVDIPEIKPDEVLAEVKFTGICGTDVHIYHDSAFYTPPVIMGHEYSGVIARKGSQVAGFDVGDRVTSPATIPCGSCLMCRTNHANRCSGEEKRILGTHKADGTFTKYVAVPSRILHKIPEALSLEEAAVAELAACVVRAVFERVRVERGDLVAVLGPGPMGLLTVQAAKISGARQVLVTGMGADKDRFEVARSLGADLVINVEEEDPVEVVKALSDGWGADVVFEASGASAARKQAFSMVRRCGKVGLIGLTGKPAEISLDKIVEGELDVKGSWGTVWTSWQRTLDLLSSGKMQVDPLITAKLPLEKWREGFKMMEERKALKVLLIPP